MTDERPLFHSIRPPLAKAEQDLAFPRVAATAPTAPETPTEKLAREIVDMEKRIELRTGLPFLYGWKWYKWARKFYESTNKINLLTAANQISKSSTQIRKCINWATNKDLWTHLWSTTPNQFWYLYPSQKVVNAEFLTKWKQFLPHGKFKDDPYYGWKELKDGKDTIGIEFFSGVIVFFKTYSQRTEDLQSGTCYAIFCDEELPIEVAGKNLLDELMLRINATDGYFHMVFTATIGQDEWRRAMEPKKGEEEFLPQAFKQTVSVYDCQFYEDGTRSFWSNERINQAIARCSTKKEIQKRIFGRFIVTSGLKYQEFDIQRHVRKKHHIPKNWLIYCGVDIGSGGENGHKSAICYVGVSPDMRKGRVFLGWRGPDDVTTTAGDVVKKNMEIKKANNIKPTQQFYDHGNADFANIAITNGESYEKADKRHDVGEEVINTLFKNDMLFIYESDDDSELPKLISELATLRVETPKRAAKDDFADAFRYAVTKVPWDFSQIGDPLKDPERDTLAEMSAAQREIYERRQAFVRENEEEQDRIDNEISEWNEAYGTD